MVYLGEEAQDPATLTKLGKHRATKGCLYVKRLADIDLKVLKAMFKKSMAATRKAYLGPKPGPTNGILWGDPDQNGSKQGAVPPRLPCQPHTP